VPLRSKHDGLQKSHKRRILTVPLLTPNWLSLVARLRLQVADNRFQGHGTLHAIYASVEESCRAKGWDTVDLLIIGGDFQVRDFEPEVASGGSAN
jgi:hypothetical protein